MHALKRKTSDPPLICTVKDCGGEATARGLCGRHYFRFRKYGDANMVAFDRAPNGSGSVDSNGYITIQIDNRRWLQHRYVMEQLLGRPLEPHENVHHINGIRGDNRPENLELWVSPQPCGQRPEDLAAWVVDHYPHLVVEAQRDRQLSLAVGP